MKVLYINSVAGRGSTGHLCEDLAKMQDSLICYGRGEYQGEVPSFRFTELPGNAAAALNTILFNRNGLSNHRETVRLIEKIRAYQPDLIHLHNIGHELVRDPLNPMRADLVAGRKGRRVERF